MSRPRPARARPAPAPSQVPKSLGQNFLCNPVTRSFSFREGELSPRAPEPLTRGRDSPALAAATTEVARLAAGEGTGVGVQHSECSRARVGGARVGRGLRRGQGSGGTRGNSRAPRGNGTIEHQKSRSFCESSAPTGACSRQTRAVERAGGSRSACLLLACCCNSGRRRRELGAPRPAGPCPFQGFAEHRPQDLHQQALHYGPCAPCVPGTWPEQLMASQADRPSQANLERAFS